MMIQAERRKINPSYFIAPVVGLLILAALPSLTGTCYTYMPYRHACQGTETLANGDTYTGEFAANVRSGTGTETLANGDTYNGEFAANVRSGTGTETLANGDTYNGEFAANVRSGTGTETLANGDAYTGGFAENVRSGTGTETLANGDSYTGEFAGNVRSGTGIETFGNRDTYTGEFAENVRSGKGVISRFATKTVIEADFKNGKAFYGVITTSTGVYEGELLDLPEGLYYDGRGRESRKDGQISAGTFKKGYLINGQVEFPNGTSYSGALDENGRLHGPGRYQYSDGTVETGTFVNGDLNGEGEITYANGNRYKGEVVNSQPSGSGTFYFADETVTTGEWKSVQNGEAVTSVVQDGKAEMRFSNGHYYFGEVVNGVPNGYGAMLYPDGSSMEGNWVTNEQTAQASIQDGEIVEKSADGTWYVGTIKANARNGIGTLKWANGESLTVQFINGRIDGRGIHVKADGTEEKGWFTENADGTFKRVSD